MLYSSLNQGRKIIIENIISDCKSLIMLLKLVKTTSKYDLLISDLATRIEQERLKIESLLKELK